jgi:hypothetical protein
MRAEKGQALVETILLGLLLLIPLVWLLGVLADLHRSALAATAAVRAAGSAVSRASDAVEASSAIEAAVAGAARDHGLVLEEVESRWHAIPRFERGARVEIEVRYPVSVVQAPLLGRVTGPSIWVDAVHVARVHPFGSRQ